MWKRLALCGGGCCSCVVTVVFVVVVVVVVVVVFHSPLNITFYLSKILLYSAKFLWVFNFVNFQPFATIFQQKILTHDTLFLCSDCKSVEGTYRRTGFNCVV